MLMQYILKGILLSFLWTSCDSNSTKSASRNSNEKQTITIPTKGTVDNNFNDFIEKFSSDAAFQLRRTKFPLKIKWYDLDNDRDSLIYKDSSGFEMIDFRTKKSIGQLDQWEQRIVVDYSSASAIIEIRGIENGIAVDYLFEKINEAWVLVEIHDSST